MFNTIVNVQHVCSCRKLILIYLFLFYFKKMLDTHDNQYVYVFQIENRRHIPTTDMFQ